jgi:hypothetical protein
MCGFTRELRESPSVTRKSGLVNSQAQLLFSSMMSEHRSTREISRVENTVWDGVPEKQRPREQSSFAYANRTVLGLSEAAHD